MGYELIDPTNNNLVEVKILPSKNVWIDRILEEISKGNVYIKVFVLKGHSEALGRIQGFDYNSRNKSIEFGYYFPEKNRGKGFGTIGIRLFIEKVFAEKKFELNKLYATTASNNLASISVLERCRFKKDGENREHYWIENKYYSQLVYSILRKDL